MEAKAQLYDGVKEKRGGERRGGRIWRKRNTDQPIWPSPYT